MLASSGFTAAAQNSNIEEGGIAKTRKLTILSSESEPVTMDSFSGN
jgi:hypothetical protein